MSEIKQPEINKQALLLQKLSLVKSEMGKVVKGSNNPFFKSSYADLNSHLDLIEPLLEKHGLILAQPVVAAPQCNIVISRIFDTTTGEFIESSMTLPTFDDMQKLGGAITYARRYTLSALGAMGAEDDDANFATGKGGIKSAPKSKAKTKAVENDF